MKPPIDRFLILPSSTIGDALRCIDRNTKGIALVADEQRRLVGTVTDGDVRRGILAGLGLDAPVEALLQRKASGPYRRPCSTSQGTATAAMLRQMREHGVRHLPILDSENRVVDLVVLSDLTPEQSAPLQAIVMAGGFGRRLSPLTEQTPKPMLPLGDRPLLERTIERLRSAGIQHVRISTHFMAERIREHFGNGERFGLDIDYLTEEKPLGTAGALALLGVPEQPLLVINGDILTEVDFLAMKSFHQEHAADLSVAVRRYDFQVPYGVVLTDGVLVTAVEEKPRQAFFVNAGIYILEPKVCQRVPGGRRFDMPELIAALLAARKRVVSFPIVEYWLDIGSHADYRRAQDDFRREQVP